MVTFVSCLACGGALHPDAPACPTCGAPAGSSKPRSRKKLWLSLGAVFVVLAGGGTSLLVARADELQNLTFDEWVDSLRNGGFGSEVSASALLAEYEKDDTAARLHRGGKRIRVKGVVGNVGENLFSKGFFVTLSDSSGLVTVTADLEKRTDAEALLERKGQPVVVNGWMEDSSRPHILRAVVDE
jgi:hypothetical protein